MSAKDETTPTVEAGPEDLFSGMKKKKKKKATSSSPAVANGDASSLSADVEAATVDSELESLNLGPKKKKSSKKKKAADSDFEKQLAEAGLASSTESAQVSDESATESSKSSSAEHSSSATADDLSYNDLLDRFFVILKENNPELAGERSGVKWKIPPPVVTREPKKSIFANVKEISKKLNRDPEHVIQYLFAELGTSGSVDGKSQLIIKGKFFQKQIEYVLKKYIIEYVTCQTCKSINTKLVRENANRLYFLVCNSCGSSRSVSSIKTGFQATIKRKKV